MREDVTEHGPQLRPEADEAIRRLVMAHVRAEPARKRNRVRALIAWIAGLGVVGVGAIATAGVLVRSAEQVSNQTVVNCLAADERGPDGELDGRLMSIAEPNGTGFVGDPIAVCTMAWEQGVFEPGYDPASVSNVPGVVPDVFQMCLQADGSAAVVPSDNTAACLELGLRPAAR